METETTDNVTIEDLQRNGTILLLDVPQGTEFGIDYASWTVGPKFKGVKLIPPGVHYLHYSSVDRLGHPSGIKTSFFSVLQSGEIIVKRWNPDSEDFDELPTDEAERYKEGVSRFEFDAFLGPYPRDQLDQWYTLSAYITPQIVSTLEPVGKKIFSEFEPKDPQEKELLDIALYKDQNPRWLKTGEKVNKTSGTPFYSTIPDRKTKLTGASAVQVTSYHFDKSTVLYDLMKRYTDENGVLGELQFSFVTFLLGQDYEGFEHWKQMVAVYCNCDQALHKYPKLFCNYIAILHFQLKQVPQDFFVDIISKENFLFVTFKNFLELLNDPTLDLKLQELRNKFKKFLGHRFGEDFIRELDAVNEDDEDAPVVVNMDD